MTAVIRQFVTRTLKQPKLMTRRDEAQCGSHLVRRSERVPSSVYEKYRRPQLWKMIDSHLVAALGRVQRIGQEEQAIGKFRLFGGKNARLAPPVRVPSGKNRNARVSVAQFLDGIADALAVSLRITRARRSGLSRLPVREIKSQDGHPPACESCVQSHKQRRIRI